MRETSRLRIEHRSLAHRTLNATVINMAKRTARAATEVAEAILYFRVSTGSQAASGLGLEAQEAACRRFADARGLKVVATHTDAGLSGKDGIADRPGLRGVLESAKAHPGAVVVVYSLSRLGRSQRLIWELLDDRGEYALKVASASEPFDTSTPMGRAMLGMIAVWSQLEADLTSERTVAALSAAKERGTKLGAPSMVEKVTAKGERVFDDEKVALVRRVQEMYSTGEFSHRSLADKLNADGIASVTGAKWHPRTVRVAIGTVIP